MKDRVISGGCYRTHEFKFFASTQRAQYFLTPISMIIDVIGPVALRLTLENKDEK